jgi:hypothetical protein
MKVHISPPLQQEHLVAAALVPENVADFLSFWVNRDNPLGVVSVLSLINLNLYSGSRSYLKLIFVLQGSDLFTIIPSPVLLNTVCAPAGSNG